MSYRMIIPMFLLALLISPVLTSLSMAQDDPILVETFRNEFINWATTHEEDFTFPEQQLYTQVLCNITIARAIATPGTVSAT